MGIEETLAERAKQHGDFIHHCIIEDKLRNIILTENLHRQLTIVQKIGLGMIMHKIARILNNGHNHKDSWHDIAGYALLVEQSIEQME